MLGKTKNVVTEVARNPHIASKMFLETYEIFYEYLLKKILKAKYVWIRIEFQHRGSIHLHGFAKLPEPKPGIANMANIMKFN
jgi:hypothetical protein